jgi:hypothetical protein
VTRSGFWGFQISRAQWNVARNCSRGSRFGFLLGYQLFWNFNPLAPELFLF